MTQHMLFIAMLSACFMFLPAGAAEELATPADKDMASGAGALTAPEVLILAGNRTTFGDIPFVSFACKAAHQNKAPLMFVGYRPDSFGPPLKEGQIAPIYVVELRRDGEWKEHPIGWCGTGMDGIELAAGGAEEFGFAVPLDPEWEAVRVGIRWSQPLDFATSEPEAFTIAWSEPFTLAKVDEKSE